MRSVWIVGCVIAATGCASTSAPPPFVATPTFCACASARTTSTRANEMQDFAPDRQLDGRSISATDHSRILAAFGYEPEKRIRSIVDDWIAGHELLSADFSKNPIGYQAKAFLLHRWKAFAMGWTSKLESDVSAWKKAADTMGGSSAESIEAEFAFHDHLASALDDVSQKTRARGTGDVEAMIDEAWQAQKGAENGVTLLATKLSNEASVGTSVMLPLVVTLLRWRLKEHVHATASAMAEAVVSASVLPQQTEWLALTAPMKNGSP